MPALPNDHEERILDLMGRHLFSIPPVTHRVCSEPDGLPLGATYSALARLRKRGYLGEEKLYGTGREVYHHLTPRGAVHLGLPPSIGHGFDNLHVRAHHLGQLLFCCGRVQRPKFTGSEFTRIFPGHLEAGSELRKRFHSDAYFLDETNGVRRLGRILVDTGGNMLKTMEKALAVAALTLTPFVRERRFTLAVVFPTHAKMRHFRYCLRQSPSLDGVHVILDAQPALLPLVATAL